MLIVQETAKLRTVLPISGVGERGMGEMGYGITIFA